MSELKQLSEKLGHTFGDVKLLAQALSHRSVGVGHNERLEFLGDSVLGFIMSSELYRRYPQAREGELSRLRASLVNGETLGRLAKDLGMSEHLRLGIGEQRSGGKRRCSILADALEAIIGAIYLDAGLSKCRECIVKWYGKRVDDLSRLVPSKDAKSCLQEWLQARKLPLPIYESKALGEAHAQTFIVACRVEGLAHVTEGVSSSRRKAEQIAAQNYLDLLDDQ